MASRCTGYRNNAYSSQYDDPNAGTSEQFGPLFECYNETFVDDESYRSFSPLYPLDDIDVHDSPLGASANSRGNTLNVQTVSRESTPNTTPKKRTYIRSHSAPSRRNTTAIYGPTATYIRQDAAPALRRSRSTVLCKPNEEIIQKRKDIESQLTVKHALLSQSSYGFSPMERVRYVTQSDIDRRRLHAKQTISVIPAARKPCVDVNSNRSSPRYGEISETSLMSRPPSRRVPTKTTTTSNRKSTTNLAVIPPNHRASATAQSQVPLLAKSPDKFQTAQRHSPAKASWVHLPTQPVATTSVWLSGVILIVTGFASCFLCFCIFSKKGRTYYVDMGTISAFVTIVLGFLGLRSSKWEWFPNRNYVSGFLILSGLNVVQCLALGLLAVHGYPYWTPQIDMAAGAVCGLSFLILFLAIFGLCATACCMNPPPDNRVAHCAAGFTI